VLPRRRRLSDLFAQLALGDVEFALARGVELAGGEFEQ
jgi:hypothetical protein